MIIIANILQCLNKQAVKTISFSLFLNSHSEAIQCLAYNPVSLQLASCAISDFAFWSMDVKAVQKHRVSGRITSCAWSLNGQYLAIGLAVGAVSIRNKVSSSTDFT